MWVKYFEMTGIGSKRNMESKKTKKYFQQTSFSFKLGDCNVNDKVI